MGLPLFVGLKIVDMEEWIKDTLKGLLLGLLACAAMQLLWGCRSVEYVPVPSVSVDSVYVDRWMRDSVYLHDSVSVNQWMKGDTVFVDKVVTKYKYKDRWRYDTVSVLRADTVSVPYPVEKQLSKFEKLKIGVVYVGYVLIFMVFAILIGWMISWLKEKLKKK